MRLRFTAQFDFVPRGEAATINDIQAMLLDAEQELKPVAKRLQQRKQSADEQAVTASMVQLHRAVIKLAQLTKYSR